MNPFTSEKPQDDAKGTESRVTGKRRAMVMPNGSPVLTDASVIPIAPTSPAIRPHDRHQDCGHPDSQNNCAFCLRSEADFNKCLVTRDEDGRWVSSGRQPVDLSGVPRRLFQSHRSEPTPDIERPSVEEVDDVLRDVISEGCEEWISLMGRS